MDIQFSIITPSFNHGRFIERTILSVLNQDILGLEYIVIDGGSSDNTVAVLKQYSDKLRWVSEKDQGQAEAVNKGIKLTQGEIIGWLNSDDIYYPGALAEVLAVFNAHPEVDVIYGNADHINIDDQIIEPYPSEDWNYERLKEVCYICQPAVFFRRRVINRWGFLDDRLQYCMDYEYWLRIGAIQPFYRLRKRLAGSRLHGQTKTLGQRIAVHREINDMFKQRLGFVPSKWIFNYAHALVDTKGFDRTTSAGDLKYVFALIMISLYSFVRWRQPPVPDDMRAMLGWAEGSLKKSLR